MEETQDKINEIKAWVDSHYPKEIRFGVHKAQAVPYYVLEEMKKREQIAIEALEFYAKGHHLDNVQFTRDLRHGKVGYEEECQEAAAYESVAEDVEDGATANVALAQLRGEDA